jgi:hypothetical protein
MTVIRNIKKDDISGALVTIDFAHHEAHEGHSFYYNDVIALGNGATQDYILQVPDVQAWPHFGFSVNFNDGAGIIELYESTDRIGTTPQTVINRERNGGDGNNMLVYKDQSGGSTDGTRILWQRGGSGKTAGAVLGSSEEIILKQNTWYLLRVTNATNSTNNTTVIVEWYEHVSEENE